MGTTEDKLNKLKETKAAIGGAIVAKGVDIQPSDTFASYSGKILEIQTGVPINNQNKVLDVIENGTKEVTADTGFTGLGKVTVNTNVPSKGLDITGTGWETEPIFPVSVARIDTLKEDVDYTKTKFSEWDPATISANSLYRNDQKLIYAPNIDTSNLTDSIRMFEYCTKLVAIPRLDTKNITNVQSMFDNNLELLSIPLLDFSKVTNAIGMLYGCIKLQYIGGFKGLKTDIVVYTEVPKESLINIMVQAGTVTNKEMDFGTINLAKLTKEEKAIATKKGWTLR